jgi:ABC-type transport system substrate-binding protein
LQLPKHNPSKYDNKNESQIRQNLDEKMEKKVNQGVYNPKSNDTQNHAALEYMISSLNDAGIEVVLVGIPHHPWVNGYLNPGQLDGMNETYIDLASKFDVHQIQMYWESWNSDEFYDRNHLDSDGRERFCQQVTPFIDEVLLGNKPLYVAEIE